MPAKNLQGQRFGTLTVLSFSHNGKYSQFFHKCQCSCGDINVYNQGRLIRGEAQRCKACYYTSKKELPPVNIDNQYGKWIIIGDDPIDKNRAIAQCKCKKTSSISKNSLSCGTSLQCKSCARKESATIHGRAGKHNTSYLYRLWCNIKARTSNPNVESYVYYGKKGIKMHLIWQTSYEAFEKDILKEIRHRPSPQYSLNRINNEGNYEPGNINWALSKEQVLNRRVTFLHKGKPLNLKTLSKKLKVRVTTIKKLLQAGYSLKAIKTYSTLPQNLKASIGQSINEGYSPSIENLKQIPIKKSKHYQRPLFYTTHHSILQRCYNTKNKDYHYYGGKGIDVYQPWHKREVFVHDILTLIGDKPSPHHTLDRIDPNKGYYPDNIQWATRQEQARNKQNSPRLSGKGVSIQELTKLYGVNKNSLMRLICQGFDETGITFYSQLSLREKKLLKILSSKLSQQESLRRYHEMQKLLCSKKQFT